MTGPVGARAGVGAALDGVVVVDKPAGMTSHDVVAVVRRLVRDDPRTAAGPRRKHGPKVGHTGTLDPDATGVLVLCLGRATRLVPYLQVSRKTYEARMRLGIRTSTLDSSGEVVATADASAVDETSLCEALKSFVGDIEQIPPMVSAVKVGGERLYRKALRGEEVERAARRVTIHDLVLGDVELGPRAEASFLVTCSSGTYVRTLAADVGDRLGVGAHLVSLRRLGSGRFTVDDAHHLDGLRRLASEDRLDEALIPMAEALADHPAVVVDEDTAQAVVHGRAIPATGHEGPVAVLDAGRHLLAMVADQDDRARPLVVLAEPSP